ncbi:hypothetical protein [Streptomyces nodosus]|uniref:Extradiol ring-cleavage dioxygenase LigAB LigA subunit domain-containing protein n=1 Tax=Streptomyces nodosus TaxID=40318 RepID=A0A0B5DUN1_9ACTN|nr:hypothetical protein [Streptomyces nodosus]AJE44406.1 hypothetical protein SNOD_33785 [Streptomyces nodosus]MBB4796046.1 hypothetical protein [Streptomyces nodosus]QEV42892.1 hypothetical protein CP978_34020 [Streptomyces nodosus]
MSKYLLDKFLYTVDRDPELVKAYKEDPAALVARWEADHMTRLTGVDADRTTWLAFTERERTALIEHDHVTLFELGAHPFLTLTLWIGLFEQDYDEPLAMQREYAARLAHFSLPYPDIST